MSKATRSGKQTLGQINRKSIQERIEELLPYYSSKTDDIDELAHYIAYDFHMNPHTIRYFYLPMFITVGVLRDINGHITCNATEDGLTEKELQEELEEENEQRSQLGKPRVTLEEWKNMRSERKKPLEL
jgi:hypothetical protein